jgi:hypothetical protein
MPALRQRQAAQIHAVLMQQIEGQEHQLALVGMARAHLGHQAIEMGAAARVDQHQLAVENGRLRGHPAESLDHARQAVGAFRALARIEPHPAAVLDDLKPEAVPFGFMQPILALGWANGGGSVERADKQETGDTGTMIERAPPFCLCVRATAAWA